MKFRIKKTLAIGLAAIVLLPVAAAFAAEIPAVTVPNPELPDVPPVLGDLLPITFTGTGYDCKGKTGTAPASAGDKSPTTCTLSDLLPPTVLPEPNAVLAMLQGQIQLIAAALGQTPGELLNTVLGTELPSETSVVMTVNDLLNRLTGTKIFDVSSLGVLGTTEISVGNVSHGFDMTVPVAASTVDCLPTQSDAQCKAANNNPRRLELPGYTFRQSDWVPKEPTLIPALIPGLTPENAIVGTSIALPLIQGLAGIGLALVPGQALPVAIPVTGLTTTTGGLTKPSIALVQVCTTAPVPAVCQGITNLIKTNLAVIATGKGKFTNIRAQGLQTTTVNPDTQAVTVAKKGVHAGGQGLTGSNVDTAWRGLRPSLINPTGLITGDNIPIWVPLITGTSALVDNGVDFIGYPITSIDPLKPDGLNTRSCTAGGEIGTKQVGEPPVTVKYASFPVTNCRSRGSFAGFGVAVYGDHAPVNFESDLAPLWAPPPVAVGAAAEAISKVLEALAPSTPNPLTVLTYGLGLAGLVKVPSTSDPLGSLPPLPVTPPALPPVPVTPPVPLPTLP